MICVTNDETIWCVVRSASSIYYRWHVIVPPLLIICCQPPTLISLSTRRHAPAGRPRAASPTPRSPAWLEFILVKHEKKMARSYQVLCNFIAYCHFLFVDQCSYNCLFNLFLQFWPHIFESIICLGQLTTYLSINKLSLNQYIVLPPFQIIRHSKNLGKSKQSQVWPRL